MKTERGDKKTRKNEQTDGTISSGQKEPHQAVGMVLPPQCV